MLYFLEDNTWASGSLLAWLIAAVVIIVYIITTPICRTSVAYSAFISAFAGIIYNIICIILAYGYYRAKNAMFFFFAVSTSFAFVPGLIAFRRISKQSGSNFGTNIAYFGYIWVFVMVVSGLVYSIIGLPFLNKERAFLPVGHSGFIVISGLHHTVNSGRLEGKAKKYLIIYSVLNLISVIAFLINGFTSDIPNLLYSIILIFFVDIPMSVAVTMAAIYGHLWRFEYSDDCAEINRPRSVKSVL